MELYNLNGESFSLDVAAWEEILCKAQSHGWQPAGTLSPAIPFDINVLRSDEERAWDGSYNMPKGQVVGRSDARALAAALEKAGRENEKFVLSRQSLIGDFIRYAQRSGFLLCGSAAETERGDAVSLHQLASVLERHAGVRKTVSVEEHEPHTAPITR